MRPSAAVAEVDWSDDAARVAQIEKSHQLRLDEEENLRQAQEGAAADYHWWKRSRVALVSNWPEPNNKGVR